VKAARNFAIVAAIALLFVVTPGRDATLNMLLTLLSIAFFAAIALVGARLYREHRFTLEALTERQRLVLYGSVALAFLTFTATRRLFDVGGAGVLAWIALLAACSFGVFWVYQQSREY
jgi:drug/metabolite transporter (DMT)-like permease